MNSTFPIIITILIIVISSCTDRDCRCPIEDFVSEQTISDEKNSSNEIDWSITGEVGTTIKKIVDVEIDGGFSNKKYDVSTSKIISQIKNEFPQFSSQTYEFKIGRLFFCAYYSNLCNDSSIDEEELRRRSNQKLEEFKSEFYESIEKESSKSKEKKSQTELDRLPNNEDKKEVEAIKLISTFSGTVIEKNNGTPINGVSLIYQDSVVTLSNESGFYNFQLDLTGIKNEKINIYALKKGYATEKVSFDTEGQNGKIKLQELKIITHEKH